MIKLLYISILFLTSKLISGPGVSGGNPKTFLRSTEIAFISLMPQPRTDDRVEFVINYSTLVEYKFPGYDPLIDQKGTMKIVQTVQEVENGNYWLHENVENCVYDRKESNYSNCTITSFKKHLRISDRFVLKELECKEDVCTPINPSNEFEILGSIVENKFEEILVPAGLFQTEYIKSYSDNIPFINFNNETTCNGIGTSEVWYTNTLSFFPFPKINYKKELPQDCWYYKKGSNISINGYLINYHNGN